MTEFNIQKIKYRCLEELARYRPENQHIKKKICGNCFMKVNSDDLFENNILYYFSYIYYGFCKKCSDEYIKILKSLETQDIKGLIKFTFPN
jgi:hypothetical protein